MAESGIAPVAAMLPAFDFAGLVLMPALRTATGLCGMFGYFTSGVLAELAPGLSSYLSRETPPVRFVIGPAITEHDIATVREGVEAPPEVLQRRLLELLGAPEVSESALARHTLECLAWLLASERLQLRVSFPTMRYHPKVWLISDSSGTVCARGSGNATGAGVAGNIENLDVDCSWIPGSADKVSTFLTEFDAEWDDKSEYMRVFPLSDAVRHDWLHRYGRDTPPSPDDYLAAFEADVKAGLVPSRSAVSTETQAPYSRRVEGFHIPDHLVWRNGTYRHQGEAIDAFEEHGRRGVLEMATGAGKTLTALIAAHRTFSDEGALLIVVAAPTSGLVAQWAQEARGFGLEPVIPSVAGSRQAKYAEVDAALRRLQFRRTSVECVVVTNHLLTDSLFKEKLQGSPVRTMLVGDEVHNLGAARFASNPPDFFDYRLGLSATPVRQYDPEGTDEVFSFFGGVVYRFGLDRAIGVCLVPYYYHVHEVALDSEELEAWLELTAKIRANQWRQDASGSDEYLQRLYRDRRAVVENAASKVPVMHRILAQGSPTTATHALIYASSKNPAQLRLARDALEALGMRFHQVTEAESSNRGQLRSILEQFQSGVLQALLAKKVLDEGINIPEIRTAYILASTTVEREWVQRRGRVLRMAPGKDHAVIHDFIVLPPEDVKGDADIRSLLRGEIERIDAFGSLAQNAASRDGPVAAANALTLRYYADRS